MKILSVKTTETIEKRYEIEHEGERYQAVMVYGNNELKWSNVSLGQFNYVEIDTKNTILNFL